MSRRIAPSTSRVGGVCPSCQSAGTIGEPCAERVCAQRSYAFIPADELDLEGALDPLIGRYLGDWLVVGVLGSGGFGRVYKALQARIGLWAALKVLRTDPAAATKLEISQSKFELEAQALARVSHPNIVALHGAGTSLGQPWIAMELIENGRTLWDEMGARGAARPFTVSEIESILLQVLAALEAAHGYGIVHRDIKPENIMLREVPGHGTFVKVLDFGLAKIAADHSATSTLLGTPAYMAPEQLTRGALGPWTDHYALTVIAFELFTGELAFPGPGMSEVIAQKLDPRFEPWRRVAEAGMPDALRELFQRGLAIDPTARYQTVDELRQAILEATRVLGADSGFLEPRNALAIGVRARSTEVASPPAMPAAVPERRSVMPLLLAAGIAAAAMLGVGVAIGGDDAPAAITTQEDASGATKENIIMAREVVAPAERPEWVRVPKGSMVRGAGAQEVVFTYDLAMMTTEVTTDAWRALMSTTPTRFAGAEYCGDCPVDSVSWYDAVAFANRLSRTQELPECYTLSGCRGTPGAWDHMCATARFSAITCEGWRLPTEAEWEHAARLTAANDAQELGARGWTRYDGGGRSHPVATKAPNALGLYDLVGNVREWCHDGYAPYPSTPREVDPLGPAQASDKVVRGGSWYSPPSAYDPTVRESVPAKEPQGDVGFRLVRTLR